MLQTRSLKGDMYIVPKQKEDIYTILPKLEWHGLFQSFIYVAPYIYDNGNKGEHSTQES